GQRAQQGVQGVLRHPVDLLDVEERTPQHGLGERTGNEVVRPVPVRQHRRRVVEPDELGGRQIGIPLDHDERRAGGAGNSAQQGRLARSRWSFEEQIAPRVERRDDLLQLPLPSDHVRAHQLADLSERDAPVVLTGPLHACHSPSLLPPTASGTMPATISRITSSGVRSVVSCRLILLESASDAASSSTSSNLAPSPLSGVPRISANWWATSTRSIAPRTEDPSRASGCSRVARVIATAASIRRVASLPVRRATICRSSSSL